MTPIGSTSSNIRRAIEFIVSSSCCWTDPPCGHHITWTTACRQTHRKTSSEGSVDDGCQAVTPGGVQPASRTERYSLLRGHLRRELSKVEIVPPRCDGTVVDLEDAHD